MYIITNNTASGSYTPCLANTKAEAVMTMVHITLENLRGGYPFNSSLTDSELIVWARNNVNYFVLTDKFSNITYKDGSEQWMNIYDLDELYNVSSETKDILTQAKIAIMDYWDSEFHKDLSDLKEVQDSFADLEQIPLAYTTVGDEDLPVNAYANLIDNSIDVYSGEEFIGSKKYDSLKHMCETVLNSLSFTEMVSIMESVVNN